jgi:hypothetical protein
LEELEKKNNTTIQADTNQYNFSKWLSWAGWVWYLKGLKRNWLLQMARKLVYKERALFKVC